MKTLRKIISNRKAAYEYLSSKGFDPINFALIKVTNSSYIFINLITGEKKCLRKTI